MVKKRGAAVPGSPAQPIVSSAHLVSPRSAEMSEFEFGLIVAGNAFHRWISHCMSAAGLKELTPLDVLLCMMNDDDLDPDVRIRAAIGAAPYVRRRKPQSLEVAGKFEFLSPEEREQRRQLLLDEIRSKMVRDAGEATNN